MLDALVRFFLNYRSDTDMLNHVYFDYFIYCSGITSLKTDELLIQKLKLVKKTYFHIPKPRTKRNYSAAFGGKAT